MYERKKYIFEESIEVEESHIGRYGAPGQARELRHKATAEQIARQNQKNREKGIRRLIKKNFIPNDYWITLTYRKGERPPDIAAAKRDVRNFMDRLRRRYKKIGAVLKWMLVIEVGSRGGIHHHLVVNRVPEGDILITDCWGRGSVHLELLYQRGDFRGLADYMAKQPDPGNPIAVKHFSRSRNLEIPIPKRKELHRIAWNREPKPPEGYYLEKDTLIAGINPVTGHRYRHYTFVRLEERRGNARGKPIQSKTIHRNG